MLLTIGQLADHVGVTVRAIRHYHQRGLLAEPERDASGYRRYDAQAVVDLVRIKVLADAGVPLVKVRELLDADEAAFAEALAGIDRNLQSRVADLERRRQQLRVLLAGERLVLTDDAVTLLATLRTMGVSERTIQLERDGWILMTAMCPEVVAGWVRHKLAALADEEFRRLYRACDQALDWDPDDPRLEDLGRWMAEWTTSRSPGAVTDVEVPEASRAAMTAAEELMAAQVDADSPVWRRLGEIARSAQVGA